MSDTRMDTVSHQNEVPGMEEVQGDVDELIDDLNKDWHNSNNPDDGNKVTAARCLPVDIIADALGKKHVNKEHVTSVPVVNSQQESNIGSAAIFISDGGKFGKDLKKVATCSCKMVCVLAK